MEGARSYEQKSGLRAGKNGALEAHLSVTFPSPDSKPPDIGALKMPAFFVILDRTQPSPGQIHFQAKGHARI
jgi:hypothetical protein